jgi:hypothetical protein
MLGIPAGCGRSTEAAPRRSTGGDSAMNSRAREQCDQGEKQGGKHRDPALTVNPKSTVATPNPGSRLGHLNGQSIRGITESVADRRRNEGAPLRSASSCSLGAALALAQPAPHGGTRRRTACSPENLIPRPATPHARAAHAALGFKQTFGARPMEAVSTRSTLLLRGNWDWVGYQREELCSAGRLAVQHLQVF